MCSRVKTCFVFLVVFVWVSVFSSHVILTRRQQYRERDNTGVKDRLIAVLRAARERNGAQKDVANLVAELYDVVEQLRSLEAEPDAIATSASNKQRIKSIPNDINKSARPPMEFMFITPMEKAWKSLKPARQNAPVPLHRKLPAEIRPVDNNGNLMYPFINDIQPMDFDDVMTSDIPVTARSAVSKKSFLKIANASTVVDNSRERNVISDVLKAQAEYRAYMHSVLSQRRQQRSS